MKHLWCAPHGPGDQGDPSALGQKTLAPHEGARTVMDRQDWHQRKNESAVGDVQHLPANLRPQELEEVWTGVCGVNTCHVAPHISWPFGCRQHLGFLLGKHLPVIPLRLVPGWTCESSWLVRYDIFQSAVTGREVIWLRSVRLNPGTLWKIPRKKNVFWNW